MCHLCGLKDSLAEVLELNSILEVTVSPTVIHSITPHVVTQTCNVT